MDRLAEWHYSRIKACQPLFFRLARLAETMDDWAFTRDNDGDWRAVSPDGLRRTRLKASRAWAEKDIIAHRLQYRRGDIWVDDIDGLERRWTIDDRSLAGEGRA